MKAKIVEIVIMILLLLLTGWMISVEERLLRLKRKSRRKNET